MRAVNLIPSDRRGARRGPSLGPFLQSRLLVASIVVAVAAVGGVVVTANMASSTVSARQQTLSGLDAQVAKLPKPKPASSTSKPTRANVVTTVANQRTTWDGFLSAVSRVLPEDVWLSNLSAQSAATAGSSPSPSAASSPTGFTINGYTYSQPSVARLMRRLRLVPWLSDVSLSTSQKSSINNVRVYQFTVGADVIALPGVGS